MDETTNNNNQESGAGTWAWAVTGLVVVAVLAGFYYWPNRSQQNTPPANTASEQSQMIPEESLSASDEVSDIEADLKNTAVDNLDKETSDILSEINAN